MKEKFRFCGDLDCPDWIVAEIALISRLTSVKLKLVCGHLAKQYVADNLEFDHIQKFMIPVFDVNECRRCIAALLFIYESATKNECTHQILNAELQQLGLPAEHCQQVCKVFEENSKILTQVVKNRICKYDGVLRNATIAEDVVENMVCFTPSKLAMTYNLPKDKALLLVHELESALKIMKEYDRRT
uniref:COMM domain-containing protein 4 n=1 Tax=Romanomermis culicivorax TaxID=13658 RepID=A0A915I3R3_ROMCU